MLLFSKHYIISFTSGSETRTLFGHSSDSDGSVRTFTVTADEDVLLSDHERNKRDVLQPQPVITNITVQPKVNFQCLEIPKYAPL